MNGIRTLLLTRTHPEDFTAYTTPKGWPHLWAEARGKVESMDALMAADTFVDITVTAPGGARHSARFAITARHLTYAAIWTAAHQNADSSVPTLEQLGCDGYDEVMFDHVRRLRAAEAEVMGRAAADATGADAMTCDVVGCSRCGGDHPTVRFAPLVRPFAPAEAAPIVWSSWAPCPTNGQPILQASTAAPAQAEITDDELEELAAEWQANGQPTLVEVARVALEGGDGQRSERARQRCADILVERLTKARR